MLKTSRILKNTLNVLNLLQNKVENFYLAGGTALAMYYEHRMSVDLDFFTQKELVPDYYISNFKKLSLIIGDFVIDEGTLKCQIENTKVSFFEYKYPLIGLFSKYKELKVASPLDISCMKLTAIAGRAEKKDYFDLYEILKHISFDEIISALYKKYGKEIDIYHIFKVITYFSDVEESPDPLQPNTTWETVKKELIKNKEKFIKIIEQKEK